MSSDMGSVPDPKRINNTDGLRVGEHLTAPAAGWTTSTHLCLADISCRGRAINAQSISVLSRVGHRKPWPWMRRRGKASVIMAAVVSWE